MLDNTNLKCGTLMPHPSKTKQIAEKEGRAQKKCPLRTFSGRHTVATRRVEQVRKGVRWMPRLLQAMKDVISCDKPRGGANDP